MIAAAVVTEEGHLAIMETVETNDVNKALPQLRKAGLPKAEYVLLKIYDYRVVIREEKQKRFEIKAND